jgi:ferric-dicitrate binding protein FerR (iron transport regulator)
MSDTQRQRWEEIVEREMLGEAVESEDLAFRRDYEREHPECANESEAWSGMLDALASEAEGEGRARAEALASRVLVQRDVERDVVRPLRPTRRRSSGSTVRTAVLAAAAAAAVTAFVVTQGEDASVPPTPNEPMANAATASAEADPAPSAPTESSKSPGSQPDLQPGLPSGRLALAGTGVQIDGGPATAGATVHAGQRIDFEESESSASACVVHDAPWITTCFSNGSALAFADSEDGMAVELERGRVVVTLDSLPPGQSFSVVTSKGSVAAIGTSFEVWIDDQGTVRASVLEGRVVVRDAVGERPLAAGETTRLGDGEIGHFGSDALAWSRAHVETASLWRHSAPGVLVLNATDDATRGASVSVDALAVGHAPLSMLLPPGEHLVAQAGNARGASVEIEEGATREFSLTPPDTTDRPSAGRPRPTADQLVRMANEARGAHRYRDVARYLDRLLRAYPDGDDAQNARVELGDLLLDKLGNPKKALRLFDAYLSRGGPLDPEARHGRVRALERLGRPRDERAAIDAFLAKYPNDWRAKQLRARRDVLGQP